ncbi:LysR family transcriptional regulator [Rhizobium leguminosarum bv. trifolii]|uniref:LysR family transcriptional regulator n=1 Tax=Rhizobium leguminosarum TaxID=384 RepID=UPI000E2F0ADD|nr:LysR family transcriptional regulator [Rhizobium leguminosarum]RFB87564.1 LysR family transcriptional regulator [Rhizobium leguminosarum bv. trifolii]
MSRLPVSLSSLEIFAEAGRLQSFRKAGENLSLSTSAISQAVRKLEDRLSQQLFDRTGNAVKLNVHGIRLLRDVETGIEHMRMGLEAITQRNPLPLTMRSPPGLAPLFTPVIQRLLFSEDCDVRFVSDETQEQTSFHDFDVTVFCGARAGLHTGAEILGPDVFLPVCRPDVASRINGMADLLHYPLLVNETAAVTWDEWLKTNNLNGGGSKRIYFNRAAHIIAALLDGAGVALESLRILSPQIQRGELTICPLQGMKSLRRNLTYLYLTTDPSKSQRAERAAHLIREYFNTEEDGILRSKHFASGLLK